MASLVEAAEGATLMFCGRCDKPILPGEKTETYPIDSPSGGGGTVTLHARLCRKLPTQTYPSGIRR